VIGRETPTFGELHRTDHAEKLPPYESALYETILSAKAPMFFSERSVIFARRFISAAILPEPRSRPKT